MTSDQNLELLEEQADATIRRMEIDGTWYFSVIDVVAILTDAPKPRQYWYNMKRYIKNEGFLEVSQKVRAC
jgi:DNA-damage-inducible protein D